LDGECLALSVLALLAREALGVAPGASSKAARGRNSELARFEYAETAVCTSLNASRLIRSASLLAPPGTPFLSRRAPAARELPTRTTRVTTWNPGVRQYCHSCAAMDCRAYVAIAMCTTVRYALPFHKVKLHALWTLTSLRQLRHF
jgi:hypothetical protein